MTTAGPPATGPGYGSSPNGGGHQPANLGDILERVLDRGLVIVGDIKVGLLDIELLTIKVRLLVASVDTARQLGINWWENDPWLTTPARPAVESRPAEPAAVEPAAVEPAAVEPAAVEPAAVEPAAVEPAAIERPVAPVIERTTRSTGDAARLSRRPEGYRR
jgi:hypothetical protein